MRYTIITVDHRRDGKASVAVEITRLTVYPHPRAAFEAAQKIRDDAITNGEAVDTFTREQGGEKLEGLALPLPD